MGQFVITKKLISFKNLFVITINAGVLTASDDDVGFTQCAEADDSNSHEKSTISVGTKTLGTPKCSFEPFLTELEEDNNKTECNNSQQSSHSLTMTRDSFANDLVNAFHTTEDHVTAPSPPTGLIKDTATPCDV